MVRRFVSVALAGCVFAALASVMVAVAAAAGAAGVVTTYPLPVAGTVQGVATGPDGNVWFTEDNTATVAQIGRVTPDGTFTMFPLPAGADPLGITAGPDGAMWFTDFGTASLGKVTMAGTISEVPMTGTVDGTPTALKAYRSRPARTGTCGSRAMRTS